MKEFEELFRNQNKAIETALYLIGVDSLETFAELADNVKFDLAIKKIEARIPIIANGIPEYMKYTLPSRLTSLMGMIIAKGAACNLMIDASDGNFTADQVLKDRLRKVAVRVKEEVERRSKLTAAKIDRLKSEIKHYVRVFYPEDLKSNQEVDVYFRFNDEKLVFICPRCEKEVALNSSKFGNFKQHVDAKKPHKK